MADKKISELTAKSPPVDNDAVPIFDSAQVLPANQNKSVLWSVIKSTLKTYFDGLYQAAGTYLTPSGDASLLTLNPAPANLAWSGPTHPGTAGEALAIGNCCFQGPAGDWWKAKGTIPPAWIANTVYAVGAMIRRTNSIQDYFYFASSVTSDAKSAAATEPTWPTTIGATVVDNHVTWTCIDTQSYVTRRMATGTINAGATGAFLKSGYIRNDAGAALTPGQPCYLDASTAGAFTQVRPAASGNLVQIVGRAAAQAKTIDFNPAWTNVQVA